MTVPPVHLRISDLLTGMEGIAISKAIEAAIAKNGGKVVGLLFLLIGGVCCIWGCGQYAKAKGHSPYWGVLGLLSIIGLIVLVLFSDKHKAEAAFRTAIKIAKEQGAGTLEHKANASLLQWSGY